MLVASMRHRGPLAGGHRPHRNQPLRRAGGHDRRAVHPAGDAGRAGHRGGQRAGQQPVGRVHHRHAPFPSRSSWACGCSRATPARSPSPGPSVFGVVLLIAAVIGRPLVRAASSAAGALTFTPHQITLLMVAYGFVASVLPVWLLLEPRDYLSTYVKLGTIAMLIVGVFVVHPGHPLPGLHPVRSRRRAHHQGQALPVPVRDHRLRRDLRLPLAGLLGHHAEDARQGDRRALHRLRRHAVRVAGGRAGADRGLLDVPRRLLRHQHARRRCSPSWACTP